MQKENILRFKVIYGKSFENIHSFIIIKKKHLQKKYLK